jgi:restriction endonuclease Mrr
VKIPIVIAVLLLAPAFAVASRLDDATDLSRSQSQAVVFVSVVGLWMVYRFLGWDARSRRRRRLLGYRLGELDGLAGGAFEEWIAAVLSGAGWRVARTAATRDFGVDLVATLGERRIGIEAKRQQRPVSNQVIRSVVAGCQYHGCDVAAVVTQSTFTASARAQAERAQIPVVLVGRDDLHRLTDLLLEAARAVPASRDVQSR